VQNKSRMRRKRCATGAERGDVRGEQIHLYCTAVTSEGHSTSDAKQDESCGKRAGVGWGLHISLHVFLRSPPSPERERGGSGAHTSSPPLPSTHTDRRVEERGLSSCKCKDAVSESVHLFSVGLFPVHKQAHREKKKSRRVDQPRVIHRTSQDASPESVNVGQNDCSGIPLHPTWWSTTNNDKMKREKKQ
jgi:hypothetical protein